MKLNNLGFISQHNFICNEVPLGFFFLKKDKMLLGNLMNFLIKTNAPNLCICISLP